MAVWLEYFWLVLFLIASIGALILLNKYIWKRIPKDWREIIGLSLAWTLTAVLLTSAFFYIVGDIPAQEYGDLEPGHPSGLKIFVDKWFWLIYGVLFLIILIFHIPHRGHIKKLRLYKEEP